MVGATGCSRVAVHLDVDTVDADEVRLGLGYDRGGLSVTQTNRVARDLGRAADVVGLTIAEYVPRQVVYLARLLEELPLL
jgi:arginase